MLCVLAVCFFHFISKLRLSLALAGLCSAGQGGVHLKWEPQAETRGRRARNVAAGTRRRWLCVCVCVCASAATLQSRKEEATPTAGTTVTTVCAKMTSEAGVSPWAPPPRASTWGQRGLGGGGWRWEEVVLQWRSSRKKTKTKAHGPPVWGQRSQSVGLPSAASPSLSEEGLALFSE